MNPLKEHPSREQLMAFHWGQLNETDQEALAGHIAECDACCQLLREIPDDALLARLRSADTPCLPAEHEPCAGPMREQPLPKELLEHPRYKIGKFLGAGGMGLVYQAEHRLMDRQVALKIIHRHLTRHPRVLDRFRQEVKAAARLTHPNIVTAYDAEQAGESHFLVMEFVDGVSLHQLVHKQGPLEFAHACNFIRQTARGLQHAFESGMVHRDIKPHNLMLTRKCQVKILDFGLARLASETRAELALPAGEQRAGLTALGDIMGTPDYIAPEQASDSRQADIRADIYSLGCTFYFLLVGQTPFGKGSAQTKLFAQKYRQPRAVTELRDDVPPELVAVLTKMLAKNPAERYQTPAEVVKALSLLTKPGPPPAGPLPDQKPVSSGLLEPTHTESLPAEETAPVAAGIFLARCPFCPTKIRVPEKALGASICCPRCHSYFTAVPEDRGRRSI